MILSTISISLFAQGNCLEFDGSDDYVYSNAIGTISNKTMSAWVKLDNVDQDGTGIVTIQKGNTGDGGENFDALTYNETASGIGWGFGSHGWQRTSWSGIKETSTDEWVHIAAAYSDYSFKIYRNGELILTNNQHQVYDFPADTVIILGMRCWYYAGPFDGSIDEVRVWNYARTQQEIQDDMYTTLAGDETGLVAYYKLNETSGQTAFDSSINRVNNHGTLGAGTSGDINDPSWILSDAPLPVTLSSFNATFSGGSSLLSWTTQSESNNLGWNVYRSETENVEDYLQINNEMIEGAGTTAEQTDYTFADEDEVYPANSYWYWIESVDNGGTTVLHGPDRIDIPDTEDELPPELLSNYGLAQNFPNPFNPSTVIAFKLIETDAPKASLIIYNTKGQVVRTFNELNTNENEIGSVTWNGADEGGNTVSSGMYFYKLITDESVYSKKMIMMK